MSKIMLFLLFLLLAPVAITIVITPMGSQMQYLFGLLSLLIFILLNRIKNHQVSVILVVFSVLSSTRYLYFRATQTLSFETQIEAILGILLFVAELYSWIMLLLGYMQNSFPLERKIQPLPEDISSWPTVDVYIPSYNEDLDIVSDTVFAAQCMDYPQHKINIYLLDDGNRKEFAVFAAKAGVGYITRTDNTHAKAGNLNHALELTHGELICIFDCDHTATRLFLQSTVGAFLKDSELGLIQTPHHFYSPDPFERNLYGGRDIPNEGELFYGPIQQGNDAWNAAFFCGSCAVLKREALDDIGGFAVETVTEDAHTALKMQRRGWNTAYLPLKLSAGLATERLATHIVQRNRWARGMIQIFRMDNPLFGRGLTIHQRLCYLSAMMYFLFPLPRMIYLIAPLAFLLFDLKILHSSAALIFAYGVPHFIISAIAASRLSGNTRYSFWGDIYDITLAPKLVLPVINTMFFPKHGKFNVTDKGGSLDNTYFDSLTVRPHIFLAITLFIAVLWGAWRFLFIEDYNLDPAVLALNVGWASYSLLFLLAAIATARETKQERHTVRLAVQIPAVIYYSDGIASRTQTIDISMGGCLVNVPNGYHKPEDVEEIELQLSSGAISIPIEKLVVNQKGCALQFRDMAVDDRRELVRIVLSRADAWICEPRKNDNPFTSFYMIIGCLVSVVQAAMSDKKSAGQAQAKKSPPLREEVA
ncbi:UDP-forming cellulose synthase catalytic subunit [Photobacterium sp. BZF1]|uniref:UDP-forming cellulose synthase catalytic subunit n=1 Tax=Photobacterium sp. BZF1 TaxID=1904457 RepID=UPI001653A68C|nr:UDP-forming cellulose synthase catalytic subunit [Photobacterium sp. BZF1]MBC7006252.1 UDP-forming cellulose synthase catalytic subunit [Photobacterium sp. BZF1]